MELTLELPRFKHKSEWLTTVAEFTAADTHITPYALTFGVSDYTAYLYAHNVYHIGTEIPPNYVPSTAYFLMLDNRIVGAIDVRHRLNDNLLHVGGHIGYGIRPSERGKGYANRMLELGLEVCAQMGIHQVLLCCDASNTRSRQVILHNGGVLENEVEANGDIVQRYWIEPQR